MKTVLKNGMIDVYFKEEIEWDLEKIFYGVEQLLLINVKVLGKKVEKESAVVMSKLQEITLQVRQDV
jgi:hypothetical protein